jgi:oxygen-independent coproporphyrinogen-3 oxidase
MQKTAAGSPVQEEHALSPKDLGFEFMMNALRLAEGFEVALFAERTGLALTAVERPLREAVQRGLITRDHVRIAPTRRGQRFLNDLLQLFLPPGGAASKAVSD